MNYLEVKVRNIFILNLILILDYSTQKDVIKEIIKEEDEYKNNNIKNSEENNLKNKNININNDKDKNDNTKFNKENNFQLINNKINQDNNFQKLSMKDLNYLKKRKLSNYKIKNDNQNYFNSFKKSRLGIQNETEDISKFRAGLFSAGSSTNNNIIIPIIQMRDHKNLLIFDGIQKRQNNNLNVREKIFSESKEIKNINQLNNYKLYNIYSNGRNNIKRKNWKNKYNTFMDIKMGIENKENRKNILNKLHKIKIEKGMMNSSIVSNFNKKLFGEQNFILPRLFNATNKKNIKNFFSKSSSKNSENDININ